MKTDLAKSDEEQSKKAQRRDVRSADARVSTPELNGEEDHEEGVGAQVGRVGEVGIEGGRAHLVLHEGKPGRLPAHDGDEAVSQRIAPGRQSASVCSAHGTH